MVVQASWNGNWVCPRITLIDANNAMELVFDPWHTDHGQPQLFCLLASKQALRIG